MASGKLSPRQKMIGMMYLVLTALLALNVSREILDSFVTVNTGLENTGKNLQKGTNALYAKFDEKKSVDPLRVLGNWQKAQQVRKMSIDLSAYIDNLKKRLIRECEGFTKKEEDTIHLAFVDSKDNYDTPTNVLIGESEDGSAGIARELKNKMADYKKQMLALLPEADRKQMNLAIETEDPKGGDAEHRTWEMHNFYHTPLAADITLLSKFQTDIKNAESDVVDALLKNVDADVIPFDTVAPKVVAQSNYVLLGEEYKADIFLAAFNKTLKPKVVVGADSLNIDHGLGKYSTKTSKEGFNKYSGTIYMKTPKGQTMSYAFESEYIVARPSMSVAADKMNVFYAGVDNPITVTVPGVANEKVKASISSGTLTPLGNGKYKVTGCKAGKATISVTATTEDGQTRSMGTIEYRVKSLPKPLITLCGVTGSGTISASQLQNPTFGCVYPPDFDFEAKPTLKRYNIYASKNGMILLDKVVNGAALTDEVRTALKQLKSGCRLFVSDADALGADGVHTSPIPVSITIKN